MFELEFDPVKDAVNREKHDIGLAAAAVILEAPHVRQRSAVRTQGGEERWLAMGRIEGRVMVCVYTARAGAYRIISLRAARAKEKKLYEEAFKTA
jgi:uncharacterized DUF497 family protein